jgi:hypothetical protein
MSEEVPNAQNRIEARDKLIDALEKQNAAMLKALEWIWSNPEAHPMNTRNVVDDALKSIGWSDD